MILFDEVKAKQLVLELVLEPLFGAGEDTTLRYKKTCIFVEWRPLTLTFY